MNSPFGLPKCLVWELTDFFNYLMVIPNVIALIALWKVVAASARGKK